MRSKFVEELYEGERRALIEAALIESAQQEIARLNEQIQQRDKCSFMGPMRDCPTHGESKELAAARERIAELEKEVLRLMNSH